MWCGCLLLSQEGHRRFFSYTAVSSSVIVASSSVSLTLFMLLLLSRFSCVWLSATPETAAHQAPPSLGFSRQEHWSGLPFPSPVHACMLSCFSHVWLCATPWTAAHQAPLVYGILQARIPEWVAISFFITLFIPLLKPPHFFLLLLSHAWES